MFAISRFIKMGKIKIIILQYVIYQKKKKK